MRFSKHLLNDNDIVDLLHYLNLEYKFYQYEVCTWFHIKDDCDFLGINLCQEKKYNYPWIAPDYPYFGVGIKRLQWVSIDIDLFRDIIYEEFYNFLMKAISRITNGIKDDYLVGSLDALIFYQKNCEIYVNIMYKETDLGNAICKYFPNITYVSPDLSNTEIYELGATSDSAKHSEKNPWWHFWK